MVTQSKRIGPQGLRLLAVLSLLGWPQIGRAAGTWSVISLPQQPGEVISPGALAVDTAGNPYVADGVNASARIEKRDAQGNWSILATAGNAPGQVDSPTSLAVDTAGNLYVADQSNGGRIQMRDAQGNWSVLAPSGSATGQVNGPIALAVDPAGNLHVADRPAPAYLGRIQKRDAQGRWSVIADRGPEVGGVTFPTGLAVDTAGNLYVAERLAEGNGLSRIQKRDAQGNWSVIADGGSDPGQVSVPSSLAVDPAGNLYVAERYNSDLGLGFNRIQKRDVQGNWSVVAAAGTDLGQVSDPAGLAVDTAGNLYVVDTGNDRVQEYTVAPGP
jgi:DNA-binding beta-propeller fold protein YncE